MKYFVVSDVHSFFYEMKTALDEAGFDINNPEHIFVSCGDLFDRGNNSKECLNYVMSIPEDRRILIKGNHESLLENMIKRKAFFGSDIQNGTFKTFFQLSNSLPQPLLVDEKARQDAFKRILKNKKLKAYLDELKYYYETEKYIFVHAWIPDKVNWRKCEKEEWEDAMWVNGYDKWYKGIVVYNKTIVCGHWHTSYAHTKYHHHKTEFPNEEKGIFLKDCCFEPFYDEGIIGIDACTALTHKVNCLVLE